MIKFKMPKINLSVQLILVFITALFLGDLISPFYKSLFLAISLSIKECLLLLLPFVIFCCLFYSMVNNQSRAIRFVCVLLATVCISNFLSILAAFGIASLTLPSLAIGLKANTVAVSLLEPLWTVSLPTVMSNEMSLLLGLGLGILFSLLPYQLPITLGRKANEWVTLFLQKIFIPTLPLFAFGFILKMQDGGILARVLEGYAPIVALLIIANIVYLSCMFSLATQFKMSKWLNAVKNVLPAGLLGFTTMSSLASMPVTMAAAEKNTNNPEAVRAIIPATVNIHMMGDSISIPIVAMGVLLTFGHNLPDFTQYLLFTQFFMLAKFAVPAIPCGSMLVMLPVFEQYLGFTPEMSAFIAAIYILFDPIITAANIFGNSALAIVVSRFLGTNKSQGPAEII
jgi:Na+/H+-dicarboxylate symporter